MYLILPAIALIAAWVLLLLGVEPVPTWFYVFAWYPTLALLDALACRRDHRGHWLLDWRLALSLLGWSAPVWLVFELLNFRLQNWYYVFLPRALTERWLGILLSFATVVPAIVLAERLLAALGVGRRWRSRPVRTGVRDLRHLAWIGWAILGLVLLLPAWLYPLAWAATLLIADPIVYRRRPALSLVADIARGDWGRLGRLMLGGLGIGAMWEGYNFVARGKWIYTVPLLEHAKWFEMPPVGFVGFAFFALEAWAMYHALCVLGAALPVPENHEPTAEEAEPTFLRLRAVALAGGLTALFSVAVLLGMERWTISSTVPVMTLPTAPRLTSPWRIARMDPAQLAMRVGVSTDSARHLRERARLLTLRGIGSVHADQLAAQGVLTVCDLAAQAPEPLWQAIHRSDPRPGPRPTDAELRVWHRAATAACGR